MGYRCISIGDYYEAAKRKCAQSGGHLATLAELRIARENGKRANNSGYYWVAEERGAEYAYLVYNAAVHDSIYKDYAAGQVMCIGGE